MAHNILTSLKPLIIISQLWGFALYEINQKTWEPDIKILNVCIIFKSILVNVLIHYLYWSSYLDFNLHGTKVVQCTIPKLVYCNLMSHTLIQSWFFLKRRDTVNMLKLTNEIDKKLLELNIQFDYKKQQRKIVRMLIGAFAFIIFLALFTAFIIKFYDLKLDSKLPLIKFYGFACCTILLFKFSIGMTGIRNRFEKMNEFIHHHPQLMDIRVIKKLTELHFMICKLITNYNSVYGATMMFSVAIAFLWFCLSIFITATGSANFIRDYFFVFLLQSVTTFGLYGICFYEIYLAEKIKNEGKKLKNSLFQILHKADEFKRRELIESFIYQIDHTSMEISSVFFDFNWRFMFKVIFKKKINTFMT